MFDFGLPELMDAAMQFIPSVSSLMTVVAAFWGAYQVIGLFRKLLGFKSQREKEAEE